MRDVMKKHDVSRYNDTLFVELREQFNRLRSEWHLCGVEKASMKSWVAHERKALRDAANGTVRFADGSGDDRMLAAQVRRVCRRVGTCGSEK